MYNYQELGLVNTKEMFAKAYREGYAVPALNFVTIEQLNGMIDAVIEKKSPVILLVSPVKALIFAIVFTALQQLDANLVYPHVVGSSVGLPGMWVLMSVTVGGSLFGLVGMLILIPIASVVYTLFREHVYKKLAEKEVPEEKYLFVPEREEGLLESLKKVKIGGKRERTGNTEILTSEDAADIDIEKSTDVKPANEKSMDVKSEVAKPRDEIMDEIKEELGVTPMNKETAVPVKTKNKKK